MAGKEKDNAAFRGQEILSWEKTKGNVYSPSPKNYMPGPLMEAIDISHGKIKKPKQLTNVPIVQKGNGRVLVIGDLTKDLSAKQIFAIFAIMEEVNEQVRSGNPLLLAVLSSPEIELETFPGVPIKMDYWARTRSYHKRRVSSKDVAYLEKAIEDLVDVCVPVLAKEEKEKRNRLGQVIEKYIKKEIHSLPLVHKLRGGTDIMEETIKREEKSNGESTERRTRVNRHQKYILIGGPFLYKYKEDYEEYPSRILQVWAEGKKPDLWAPLVIRLSNNRRKINKTIHAELKAKGDELKEKEKKNVFSRLKVTYSFNLIKKLTTRDYDSPTRRSDFPKDINKIIVDVIGLGIIQPRGPLTEKEINDKKASFIFTYKLPSTNWIDGKGKVDKASLGEVKTTKKGRKKIEGGEE